MTTKLNLEMKIESCGSVEFEEYTDSPMSWVYLYLICYGWKGHIGTWRVPYNVTQSYHGLNSLSRLSGKSETVMFFFIIFIIYCLLTFVTQVGRFWPSSFSITPAKYYYGATNGWNWCCYWIFYQLGRVWGIVWLKMSQNEPQITKIWTWDT